MKDSVWFTHDADAINDPKLMLLVDQLGLEGYGIFWLLVETLRSQPEYKYPMNLLPILAKRHLNSAEKFQTIVKSYGLFQVDENQNFFSLSLNRRMERFDTVKEKRRIAGIKSGQARRITENNEQTLNTCSTHVQQNANKPELLYNSIEYNKIEDNNIENNSKKEKVETKVSTRSTFKKPELDEVLKYFIEKGYQDEAENFYSYYESNGWYVGKVKMKSWPDAANNWMKRSDQFKTNRNGKAKLSYAEAIGNFMNDSDQFKTNHYKKPYITDVLRNY